MLLRTLVAASLFSFAVSSLAAGDEAEENKAVHQVLDDFHRAAGVEVTPIGAGATETLVRKLKNDHAGQAVLVAGHSNTVPGILAALGVERKITLEDGDYGDLFLVLFGPGRKSDLVSLRFGD